MTKVIPLDMRKRDMKIGNPGHGYVWKGLEYQGTEFRLYSVGHP